MKSRFLSVVFTVAAIFFWFNAAIDATGADRNYPRAGIAVGMAVVGALLALMFKF